MTTFQDPQPQSRRAVRQSERGQNDREANAESSNGFTQFPAASADMWDTTARRAAQLPPAAPAANAAPPTSGRRSAGSDQPAPAGEPLTYSTQSRSNVPSYDGPTFRSRQAPAPVRPEDDALPPTQAMPRADQPAYRVRDFSPEGRRAAPPVAPSWNAPAAAPAPVDATPLEYHTEARIAEPVAAPEPVAEVPAFSERTLTRRELRALQLGEAPAAEPVAPQQFVAQPPAAQPPVAQPPVAAQPPAAAEPVTEQEPAAWPFGNLVPAPVPETLAAPIAPHPLIAPEPSTNTALTNAIAEFDALTQAPEAAATPRVVDDTPTSVWTAPVGHWSTQAGLDDESQPYESTINRTVGSGTVTTSALVLPTIPEGSDIRGPLTGTGEIMLTGSIDLPHTFTSTGATARVEHHGIDALFDLHDAEVVTTDSQPVRAISAVSTHNSGQGVTHTQKPKGTRALTALVISAASMAVVVVGLLVAVFALKLF